MARQLALAAFSAVFLLAACAPIQADPLAPPRIEPGEEPQVPMVTAVTVEEDQCRRTAAGSNAFRPPVEFAPRPSSATEFWFGTERLWTRLPADGIWSGLPANGHGYVQKVFWWSVDFHLPEELEPALMVSGRRIDGSAPPLAAGDATNASAGDLGNAMLVGVAFPTKGCWEVTGSYRETRLTFVVELVD